MLIPHKIYLDYLNNFLSLETLAEYYNISVALADDLINEGRIEHNLMEV